jgi:hypothetical protein
MTYIATCKYRLYISGGLHDRVSGGLHDRDMHHDLYSYISGGLHDRDARGRAHPQTHAHLPPEGH